MKARYLSITTPAAGQIRNSMKQRVVMLSMMLIGLTLGATLYQALKTVTTTAPATSTQAALLDQHERHPSLFVPTTQNATLDQHERHPSLFIPTTQNAALDQHERHPASLVTSSVTHYTSWPRRHAVLETITGADIYAPLDQHERHPALFAPKAANAARPDALDRHLAARDR